MIKCNALKQSQRTLFGHIYLSSVRLTPCTFHERHNFIKLSSLTYPMYNQISLELFDLTSSIKTKRQIARNYSLD